MRMQFSRRDGEEGGETGVSGRFPASAAFGPRWTGGSQLAAAVASAACVAVLAGCGGTASADGDWSGRIVFGEEDGREAAELSLLLSQAENGAVGGAGVLAVEAGGERKEMELREVSGRVSEGGELVLAGSNGEFLSEMGVELRGELGDGSINGEATVGADGLLPDVLGGTGLLSGTESLSGEFGLEREGE